MPTVRSTLYQVVLAIRRFWTWYVMLAVALILVLLVLLAYLPSETIDRMEILATRTPVLP